MVRRSADPIDGNIVQKGNPGGGEEGDRLSDDLGRGLDAPPASLLWAVARIAGRSPSAMPRALIGLGSNLGDRARQLDRAVHILTTTPGVRGVRTSAWHPCKPVGGPPDQQEYLNGAALIQAFMSPEQLLARLQQIEQAMARNRGDRWAPRTIDLDLLLFDDVVRSSSL